ncbi:tetraspanin-6-like [Cimex lectularius]|uniref:Tetraspanin n=1 Tax=Cimex lectularius TaxID=79782 RepID=A0A8I6SB07_CIMLE|nr:tetraspanin-6-like [Cimex lectularius]
MKMCWPKNVLLLVVNVMFGVFGFSMTVLGLMYVSDGSELAPFIQSYFPNLYHFIILSGIIMVLISTFGCIAMMVNSTTLFRLYAGGVFVSVMVQIVVGIAAFVLVHEAKKHLQSQLGVKFKGYNHFKKEIDRLQQALLCCSAFGVKNWNINQLPSSCCGMLDGLCTHEKAFKRNCFDEIVKRVTINLYTLGIVSLTGIGFGILCAVFALTLNLKNEDTTRKSTGKSKSTEFKFLSHPSSSVETNKLTQSSITTTRQSKKDENSQISIMTLKSNKTTDIQ